MDDFEQAVLGLKDAFKQLDTDNDGVITRNELRSLLIQMFEVPVTDAIVDKLMSAADLDKSGNINDLDELVVVLNSIEIVQVCFELGTILRKLDVDGGGRLTASQVLQGWTQLEESRGPSAPCAARARALIEQTSGGADGGVLVDWQEFVTHFMEETLKSSTTDLLNL